MEPWNRIPAMMPPDGIKIWIRLFPPNSFPYEATWSDETQTFTLTGAPLTLPWYLVERWKSIPE